MEDGLCFELSMQTARVGEEDTTTASSSMEPASPMGVNDSRVGFSSDNHSPEETPGSALGVPEGSDAATHGPGQGPGEAGTEKVEVGEYSVVIIRQLFTPQYVQPGLLQRFLSTMQLSGGYDELQNGLVAWCCRLFSKAMEMVAGHHGQADAQAGLHSISSRPSLKRVAKQSSDKVPQGRGYRSFAEYWQTFEPGTLAKALPLVAHLIHGTAMDLQSRHPGHTMPRTFPPKPLLDHMYELHLDLLDITVLELLSTTLTDPQETLQFIKAAWAEFGYEDFQPRATGVSSMLREFMDLFVSRLGLPSNDPNSLVNLIDKMMTEPSKQVQEEEEEEEASFPIYDDESQTIAAESDLEEKALAHRRLGYSQIFNNIHQQPMGLLYLLMKVAESKSSSVVINIPKPCQLPVRQSSETSKWEYGYGASCLELGFDNLYAKPPRYQYHDWRANSKLVDWNALHELAQHHYEDIIERIVEQLSSDTSFKGKQVLSKLKAKLSPSGSSNKRKSTSLDPAPEGSEKRRKLEKVETPVKATLRKRKVVVEDEEEEEEEEIEEEQQQDELKGKVSAVQANYHSIDTQREAVEMSCNNTRKILESKLHTLEDTISFYRRKTLPLTLRSSSGEKQALLQRPKDKVLDGMLAHREDLQKDLHQLDKIEQDLLTILDQATNQEDKIEPMEELHAEVVWASSITEFVQNKMREAQNKFKKSSKSSSSSSSSSSGLMKMTSKYHKRMAKELQQLQHKLDQMKRKKEASAKLTATRHTRYQQLSADLHQLAALYSDPPDE